MKFEGSYSVGGSVGVGEHIGLREIEIEGFLVVQNEEHQIMKLKIEEWNERKENLELWIISDWVFCREEN